MASVLFFIMFGFLITHELDAVRLNEWRILPGLSQLKDEAAAQVFIWAHVPIFFFLLIFGATDPQSPMAKFLSGFAICHVGLHWIYRLHPKNEFTSFMSWALILGAGGFGGAHLVLVLLNN